MGINIHAPLPTDSVALVNLLAEVKPIASEMQKQTDAVKEYAGRIESAIIEAVPTDSAGVMGQTHKAVIVVKTVPTVKDWDAFWQAIVANRRFDLVQKRISEKAAMEIIEAGHAIPGVEKFNAKKVSLTKI